MRHRLLSLLLLFGVFAASAQEQPVAVETTDCTLHGTLLVPEQGSETALLIIAGSGPTDRNGDNTMGISPHSYALLARSLAREGYASLRYDKRGIAASRMDRERMDRVVFEDYIDDVRTLTTYLHRQGFKRVVLVGHSEGSLLALAAAAGNGEVDAVVSLCGAGMPIAEVLKWQLGQQSAQLGVGRLMEVYAVIDSLERGVVPQIPSWLSSLFPPSVMPFLISSMRYDPCREAAACTQPLLILSGSRDLQITPDHAAALHRARPDARAIGIEDMTHVLKSSDSNDLTMQASSVYINPDLPLSEGLVEAVTGFLHEVEGR